MKIITTTYEDFINAENAEHGFDYVEGMFLLGYEPKQVNGIWCWRKVNSIRPVTQLSPVNATFTLV